MKNTWLTDSANDSILQQLNPKDLQIYENRKRTNLDIQKLLGKCFYVKRFIEVLKRQLNSHKLRQLEHKDLELIDNTLSFEKKMPETTPKLYL